MKNKFFYKLKVKFRGTNYLGWQSQKDFNPTIQDTLNLVCRKIFKSEDIKTFGSGRTDSGVHSLGHVVKLEAPFFIEVAGLKKGLNTLLPAEIRVLDVDLCDDSFMPTTSAKQKTYKYLFTNKADLNPFHKDLIANLSYDLDFEIMQEACAIFIGRHDFKDFQCSGSDVLTTVREVYECKLYFHSLEMHGIMESHWVFEVTGSGFLKQMVRLMMGTLWNIGRGRTSIEELKVSLATPQGKRLGPVAPAEGLYKASVQYD